MFENDVAAGHQKNVGSNPEIFPSFLFQNKECKLTAVELNELLRKRKSKNGDATSACGRRLESAPTPLSAVFAVLLGALLFGLKSKASAWVAACDKQLWSCG
jgi:hypothetical protein